MIKTNRSIIAFLTMFGLALGIAGAQENNTATQETATQEAATAEQRMAFVRLVNFSPNADSVSVRLTSDDESTGVSPDAFQSLAYESSTDYVEVPEGSYTATIEGVQNGAAIEQQVSFSAGAYYTLAAIGLVLPEEAQAQSEGGEEGGFLGFINNLFSGGDANRDELALQLQLFEDNLAQTVEEGQTLVRVIHAAPGTDNVDLAVAGEQDTLASDVAFGESSNYITFEGSPQDLEVRVAGSQAASLNLTELNLQAGVLNTIFVIGTPLEQAPVTTVAFSHQPVQTDAAAEGGVVDTTGEQAAEGEQTNETEAEGNREPAPAIEVEAPAEGTTEVEGGGGGEGGETQQETQEGGNAQ